MKNYSLLCPTRGRVEGTLRFVESAVRTARNPERLNFLFYVDNDDPEKERYHVSIASLKDRLKYFGSIEILQGPRVGVPQAVNLLSKKSFGEVLLYSSDDQFYKDDEWDQRLEEEIVKHLDLIFCIWFNDAWESDNFCTFPIVSRRWVDILGYFMFPFFEHFFSDTWVWMLAKSIDRAIYIPDVMVEHMHWKLGKSEKDKTYLDNATSENGSRHARDRTIIDKFERYFMADVALLQGEIQP